MLDDAEVVTCAPDGTPRRAELVGAHRKEREVTLCLLPHVLRGGESVVCDKGYVWPERMESII